MNRLLVIDGLDCELPEGSVLDERILTINFDEFAINGGKPYTLQDYYSNGDKLLLVQADYGNRDLVGDIDLDARLIDCSEWALRTN